MATRNRKTPSAAPVGNAPIKESVGTVLATFAGPSTTALAAGAVDQLDTAAQRRLATQKIGAQEAAAAMPANPLKAAEHGLRNGHAPQAGRPVEPHHPIDTASTVTEDAASPKVGLGQAVDFVKDQYRHCKTILVLGVDSALVARAMLPSGLPDGSADPGFLVSTSGKAAPAFIAALARHRHFERETDPPAV